MDASVETIPTATFPQRSGSPPAGADPAPLAGSNGRQRRRDPAPSLSVVIPTKDEAANIAALVGELERALPDGEPEVIFVDDSTDATPAVIERVAAYSRLTIRLVHRQPDERTGGLGGAVVAGIGVARAPWVCVMDADLQHPPEVIPRLQERALETGDDLVVASRFCLNGDTGAFGRLRKSVSHASITSAKVMFGTRVGDVRDPMSGFFLVRREALDLAKLRPRGFKVLLEILVQTPGLRRSEVPFVFGERHAGESKASIREGGRYLMQLWRLRVASIVARVGRFGLVGATGLVVNTALLASLVAVAGLHYMLAALLATQGSTLWNFVLSDRWVFPPGPRRFGLPQRAAAFFALNNAALALRAPLLAALTSGIGVHYLASNVLSLAVLFVLRFGLSDRWIWGEPAAADLAAQGHSYDIHGLVTVHSDARLPELERFRVDGAFDDPTIRVRLGRVGKPRESENGNAIHYRELGGIAFGVRIEMGTRIEVTASRALQLSPHVLYTNVVEPILRWTFAQRGYALVHGACLAVDGKALLVTARTDTGKTTTILKTLDRHPHGFMSDDLTLLAPDGRVLTYPKPLTISRHTLHAVKTPLLTRGQRLALVLQSRLHSRSGRLFAMIIARTRLPAATINAVVQCLVPPPKYDIQKLVPEVALAPEGELAAMVVIERGGVGTLQLGADEALETLLANCEDAYGFPPYAHIEHFLHSRNGDDLKAVERRIVATALNRVQTTVMRSETMDWSERLPTVLQGVVGIAQPGEGAAAPSLAAAPA